MRTFRHCIRVGQIEIGLDRGFVKHHLNLVKITGLDCFG